MASAPPQLKYGSYKAYVHDRPVQFAGFKVFYKNDKPMLTPAAGAGAGSGAAVHHVSVGRRAQGSSRRKRMSWIAFPRALRCARSHRCASRRYDRSVARESLPTSTHSTASVKPRACSCARASAIKRRPMPRPQAVGSTYSARSCPSPRSPRGTHRWSRIRESRHPVGDERRGQRGIGAAEAVVCGAVFRA